MFEKLLPDHVLFIAKTNDASGEMSAVTVAEFVEMTAACTPPTQVLMLPMMNSNIFCLAQLFKLLQYKNPILLCSQEQVNDAEEIIENTQLDTLQGKPLLGFFTSASTGKSRAVFHDFTLFMKRYQRTSHPIKSLCFYKPDHIAFIDVLLSTMAAGGTMVLQDHFNPEQAILDIQKHEVTHLFASPSFLALFCLHLNNDIALPSLQQIVYGSELMPEYVIAKLKKQLPHVKLKDVYATTQGLRRKKILDASDEEYCKWGEEGIDFKIENDELFLHAPESLQYIIKENKVLNAPEWIATGDLVERNANGYYKLIGRSSELINTGGEKLSPRLMETALRALPQIKDIKIYAEKSLILGELVCADVVKSDGYTNDEVKQYIRNYAREKLRPMEVPVKINFVEEIKLTPRMKR